MRVKVSKANLSWFRFSRFGKTITVLLEILSIPDVHARLITSLHCQVTGVSQFT